MSKVNTNDPDNDDLSRVYAATARDEPPAALDQAILAQARRVRANNSRLGAGSRHWRRFAAVAAMLVVSASLVVMMEGEQPQIGVLAPGAGDAALAPVAKVPAGALQPADAAPAKALKAAVPEFRRQAVPEAAKAAAEVASEPAPSALPAAPPGAESGAQRSIDAPPMAASPIAANNAAAAALAERRSSQARESVARDRLDRGDAKKDESPQAWLARIAALQRQGRIREAQESFAEFRKRYPDHPLPAAMAPLGK